LEFASVFANEERQVFLLGKGEVLAELIPQPIKGAAALGPIRGWSVFFQPGAGCRKQKLTARSD
jgi:hypothetical protein